MQGPRELEQVIGTTGKSWAVAVGQDFVIGKPGSSASPARTWASGCTRGRVVHLSIVQEWFWREAGDSGGEERKALRARCVLEKGELAKMGFGTNLTFRQVSRPDEKFTCWLSFGGMGGGLVFQIRGNCSPRSEKGHVPLFSPARGDGWPPPCSLPTYPLYIYERIKVNKPNSIPFTILFRPKEFSADFEAPPPRVPEEEDAAAGKLPLSRKPSWGPAFGAKDPAGVRDQGQGCSGSPKASSSAFQNGHSFLRRWWGRHAGQQLRAGAWWPDLAQPQTLALPSALMRAS